MLDARKLRITGWVMSAVLAFFLIGPSAIGKFIDWEGKDKMFEHLGYTQELIFKIGVLEVALALLFLVPRCGFIAAILLTGYLGGATVTHLRVGDPFFMPVLMGVFMWVALGFRQPMIFKLAQGVAQPNANV